MPPSVPAAHRTVQATFLVLALGLVAIHAGGADAPAPEHLHWQPLLEPGCGGAITALAISPHDGRRILVGGDMLGIGLSEDRGEHWQSSFALPSYEIADFTFHPSDPQVIWVGTMSGPCVSTDGGHHWTWKRAGMAAVSWSSYSAPIQKILFDPALLASSPGLRRKPAAVAQPGWVVDLGGLGEP
jgi:hypothetical protein